MTKVEHKDPPKVIAENRKANFDYHILETFEAGIVLLGTEIKSIREGGVSLRESFCKVTGSEIFLWNAHIAPYSHRGSADHDATRTRKLLLKADEIKKLIGKVEQRGFTLVPLNLHYKNGRVKAEIALAKGKAQHDKRDSIKEREGKREVERAMKQRSR